MRASFVAAVFAFAAAAQFAWAQISEEEHLSHHPELAGKSDAEASESAGEKGGMMGGGMMGDMAKMMEKMGAPKEVELYPELMRLPDLPMEKRAEVQAKAHQRMRDGVRAIAGGVGKLAEASPTDEFATMQVATDEIKEGLAQFDSGLAAHRALAEGGEPRNVALQWFRKEMNLAGGGGVIPQKRGVFGVSVFHFFSMVALVVFAVAMVWMYFFKMRRASQLMAQLAADAGEGGAGENTGAPSQPQPAVLLADPKLVPPAQAPEFPAMRSPTEPAQKWSGQLRVDRVLKETPKVRTLRLAAPDGVALPFTYYPGQFLTLALVVDGKRVKRSYTIASTPTQMHYCAVTVKREDHGLVSRHLCDEVKEGDLLEVSAANGKFTFTGEEADSIVLIGGGVGITPLMSVIRYLTDIGWGGDIFLLYCCQTTDDFIFRGELERLQLLHPNLHVFASMTREPGSVWMGLKGYFTAEIIDHLVPEIARRRIHICGPQAMMGAVVAMLAELGVPEASVLTEAFGPAKKPAPQDGAIEATENSVSGAEVTFARSGKTSRIEPNQTLLDAAERAGVEIDSSCLSGQCGLCKVRLLGGEVKMDCEDALSDGDREEGLILACQAKATQAIKVDA